MSTASDHLMHVADKPKAVMVRGRGSWLYDREGREYLDFVQGWAVNLLGHCPDVVQRALARQAAELVHAGPGLHNAVSGALAEALAAGTRLDRVFIATSGAEANEGAIKLARKWGAARRGGAYGLITTDGGLHGRTLPTMSASGKPGWDALFEPKVPGFHKVPFGDAAAVEAAIDDATVGIMVEPIQGEAGVVVPPEGYLRELRAIADRHGLLLILDEIQTGMGRTGRLFASEWENVCPDIVTVGKGLGAGVPISAVVAREEICCFEPGDQGGTFAGNPLSCAVGLAVIETISEPAFLERTLQASARLRSGLDAIALRHGGGRARGRGLLLALPLARPVAIEVARIAFERGLLVNAPRPTTIRLVPALNVSDADIDVALERLEACIESALEVA
ncbi:MAG: aminotransferase class III-fold pyridoxal phosphate-dependent enzyme [Myxococcales bacterium]|nr:aminotransferase class III-fold pyridoxal phosphate-dependent enzyme [Myxococcales bacterium]